MGKRGAKPKGKVTIAWSSEFAYAIGLLVADGCLSPSGRHIIFTSKDVEQLNNFSQALRIKVHIGEVDNGGTGVKRIQFGDVLFYRFLVSIGLTPNKSKTIGEISLPDKFFFDFLRGLFDGDGSTYSYWDKRWRSSFMFYVCFSSASPKFIEWLQESLAARLHIKGHITNANGRSTFQLKYAKSEGIMLLRRMYYKPRVLHLARKRLKIQKMLRIVEQRL